VATLELRSIDKSFGATQVLKSINLSARHGEFVVFVGPSGCGKSTLLRTIAGLETATAGEIRIDGELVNQVSAADRGCAMVFQSYALYPHMTVYQNMAFGLENAKVPAATIREQVGKAAAMLRLEGLLERKPTQLSGGQRQRVAIGRAIVREPKLFLFDEPLSNLDAELRVAMRAELRELHGRLGATMVYVTHDQVEAMTLADRIVVMRAGVIEQAGPPRELYERPANQFVAGFIGSPRMNFIPVTGLGTARPLFEGLPGAASTVGVRPEHLELVADGNGLPIQLASSEYLGATCLLQGSLPDGTRMEALVEQTQGFTQGQTVHVRPAKERWHAFDNAGLSLRTIESSVA
jgi:multiple sugar transport system ATP-binding protein